jgi:restriction endonuclease S subunit
MSDKEATVRVKINKRLETAGWRFFPEGNVPANIRLEPSVTIKSSDLDALGEKIVDWDWGFSIFVNLALIKPQKELIDPHCLAFFLNSDSVYVQAKAPSKLETVTNLRLVDIQTMPVPLPPFATQQAIVAEIEAEQALVAANRELIAHFEKKIQATRVWGEEA